MVGKAPHNLGRLSRLEDLTARCFQCGLEGRGALCDYRKLEVQCPIQTTQFQNYIKENGFRAEDATLYLILNYLYVSTLVEIFFPRKYSSGKYGRVPRTRLT